MPDDEEPDCEEARQNKLRMAPSPTPHVYSSGKAEPTSGTRHDSPGSGPRCAARTHFQERRVCACGRRVIDGDHIHFCKKHTGSSTAAHETTAVEALCHQARRSGATEWRDGVARRSGATEWRDIPSIKKQNGKTGQGDLARLKHRWQSRPHRCRAQPRVRRQPHG